MQLRGRYTYSLHFRVYKEDDTGGKWIVRSMHNSGNETDFTRSVSAEIEDLEPGTYDVVFKVTAHRPVGGPTATAEYTILKYATERKQKLLAVGRRFDYAQSKGNLRAMVRFHRTSSHGHANRWCSPILGRSQQEEGQAREKGRPESHAKEISKDQPAGEGESKGPQETD